MKQTWLDLFLNFTDNRGLKGLGGGEKGLAQEEREKEKTVAGLREGIGRE